MQDIERDLYGEASGYDIRTYHSIKIEFRRRDRYANATTICEAAGKRYNNWRANQETDEQLKAIARQTGIPVGPLDRGAAALIQHITYGPNRDRGIWLHPHAAYDLARWANKDFGAWMYATMDELAVKGVVRIAPGEMDARMLEQTRYALQRKFSDLHLPAVVGWIRANVPVLNRATMRPTDHWTDVEFGGALARRATRMNSSLCVVDTVTMRIGAMRSGGTIRSAHRSGRRLRRAGSGTIFSA